MEPTTFVAGPIAIVIAIFALVLGILWFLLPFAVFGVKARLDKLIAETSRQNVLLAEIARGESVAGKSEPRI